jgi:hypothetical protein
MKMQEYIEVLQGGEQFLQQHNQLLQSLNLSRQNAANNTYTETTQEVGNVPVQPSEGIG